MKRLYLAGPMSGLPDKNYPAFHAEAARLRALGYEVINPAECPLPEGTSWATFMRADITAMLTCDGIARLPGWERSNGASLENYIARCVQMAAYDAEDLVEPVAGRAAA